MKRKHRSKKISIGNIISGIIFALVLIGLVVFTLAYDPNAQYNSSFFDDVARSVYWK